jgi:large subunit ribosomal protein L13
MTEKMIIDATKATLGRLSSYAAKQALLGKSIIIVNCKDIIITGDIKKLKDKYVQARSRGGSSQKGPKIKKQPFEIVKRTIRGMLPHKNERGKKALKNIICYNGLPAEYAEVPKTSSGKEKQTKYVSLEKLEKQI